jgi:hypothetical protein
MCSKLLMLAKIDTLPIEEVVRYIGRIMRIYIIFTIIGAITAILAASSETPDLLALSIVQVVLYLINIAALHFLQQNYQASENSVVLPFASSVLLFLFNLVDTIYMIVELGDWWALFALLGMFSQACMMVILVKLRDKIIRRRDGTDEYADEGGSSINSPIAQAYIAPSAPVAHADVYNKA